MQGKRKDKVVPRKPVAPKQCPNCNGKLAEGYVNTILPVGIGWHFELLREMKIVAPDTYEEFARPKKPNIIGLVPGDQHLGPPRRFYWKAWLCEKCYMLVLPCNCDYFEKIDDTDKRV